MWGSAKHRTLDVPDGNGKGHRTCGNGKNLQGRCIFGQSAHTDTTLYSVPPPTGRLQCIVGDQVRVSSSTPKDRDLCAGKNSFSRPRGPRYTKRMCSAGSFRSIQALDHAKPMKNNACRPILLFVPFFRLRDRTHSVWGGMQIPPGAGHGGILLRDCSGQS